VAVASHVVQMPSQQQQQQQQSVAALQIVNSFNSNDIP